MDLVSRFHRLIFSRFDISMFPRMEIWGKKYIFDVVFLRKTLFHPFTNFKHIHNFCHVFYNLNAIYLSNHCMLNISTSSGMDLELVSVSETFLIIDVRVWTLHRGLGRDSVKRVLPLSRPISRYGMTR